MSDNIIPFEDITNIVLDNNVNESPLKNYSFQKGLFYKNDGSFFNIPDNIDIYHWEILLNNRILQVNNNFGYANFYYYKGIPDKRWHISPHKPGQTGEYFPDFQDYHYSNLYNFHYFVDVFFLQSSALYETIGHLLIKSYDLKTNGNVSFKKAVNVLKGKNLGLHQDLKDVKESTDYKRGNKMRNDNVHNHPPHQIGSGVSEHNGITSVGVGSYTTSSEVKEIMINYLKSLRATFRILERYL